MLSSASWISQQPTGRSEPRDLHLLGSTARFLVILTHITPGSGRTEQTMPLSGFIRDHHIATRIMNSA